MIVHNAAGLATKRSLAARRQSHMHVFDPARSQLLSRAHEGIFAWVVRERGPVGVSKVL